MPPKTSFRILWPDQSYHIFLIRCEALWMPMGSGNGEVGWRRVVSESLKVPGFTLRDGRELLRRKANVPDERRPKHYHLCHQVWPKRTHLWVYSNYCIQPPIFRLRKRPAILLILLTKNSGLVGLVKMEGQQLAMKKWGGKFFVEVSARRERYDRKFGHLYLGSLNGMLRLSNERSCGRPSGEYVFGPRLITTYASLEKNIKLSKMSGVACQRSSTVHKFWKWELTLFLFHHLNLTLITGTTSNWCWLSTYRSKPTDVLRPSGDPHYGSRRREGPSATLLHYFSKHEWHRSTITEQWTCRPHGKHPPHI